jgi:hypothetical protein
MLASVAPLQVALLLKKRKLGLPFAIIEHILYLAEFFITQMTSRTEYVWIISQNEEISSIYLWSPHITPDLGTPVKVIWEVISRDQGFGG